MTRIALALAFLLGGVADGFAPLPMIVAAGRCASGRTFFLESSSSNDNPQDPSVDDDDDDDDNNNNDKSIPFFDDFATMDTTGASFLATSSSASGSTPADASLTRRFQQVQAAQAAETQRIQDNWTAQNWQVRGFSLDTTDAKEQQDDASPISVTTLTAAAADENDDDAVWVGRSDGSLLLVRLGTEFVARFESVLTLKSQTSTTENDDDEDDSLSVSIASRLVRNDLGIVGANNDDQDAFRIACQCRAYENGQAIQHVVAVADKVFTVAAHSTEIIPWIPDSPDDADVFGLVAQPAWTTPSSLSSSTREHVEIIAIQAVALEESAEPTLLASVASDGTLALWDIATGALLFTCQVAMQDNDNDDNTKRGISATITSATAAHGQWVLGTEDGKIIMYSLQHLVHATAHGGPCPLPVAEWYANKAQQTPITALLVWGQANVRGTTSWVIVSGDQQGLIQQWDLLPRQSSSSSSSNTQQWDAWPKMPRQRVSERAHLLQGHNQAITSLTRTAQAIVSASRDGSVRAWDPQTAAVTTRLDGFEEETHDNAKGGLPMVILHNALLLTAGNGPHVTVHDFVRIHKDDDLLENIAWDEDDE